MSTEMDVLAEKAVSKTAEKSLYRITCVYSMQRCLVVEVRGNLSELMADWHSLQTTMTSDEEKESVSLTVPSNKPLPQVSRAFQ